MSFENRSPDDLTGSPELFATNLLIARGIENDLDIIRIEKKSAEISVTLESDQDHFDPETLTEDTTSWSDIQERFKSMTSFDDSSDASSGTLEPKTPLSERIKSIKINFSSNLITLKFVQD